MNGYVIPEHLRDRLRRAVLALGSTQAERASRLHVTVRQVQKYEAGRFPRVLFTFADAGVIVIPEPPAASVGK